MTKVWETFSGNDLELGRVGHDVSFWTYFLLPCKAVSLRQRVGMQLLRRLGSTISHQGPKYVETVLNR